MLSIDILQLIEIVQRIFLALEFVAKNLKFQIEGVLILLRILQGDVSQLEGLIHILILISEDGSKAGYLSEIRLLGLTITSLEEGELIRLSEELPVLTGCSIILCRKSLLTSVYQSVTRTIPKTLGIFHAKLWSNLSLFVGLLIVDITYL